jgi:F-type H+-transporting ATPase subunit a
MQQHAGGNHGFLWLEQIPGYQAELNHVYMAGGVAVALLVGLLIARVQLSAALKRGDEGLIPESKLSIRTLFELVSEKLFDLCAQVMGRELALEFFPLIGALFLFIFTSNLLGLIPGILPSTEALNTTLGIGIFVFFYYNYVGLKKNGLAYLKHFLGPMLPLAPLMLVIELISHIVRPISLGVRLRSNIFGDHQVLAAFNANFPYIVPIAFYGMGLFVAFIQSLVFCLMTMVYISLSAAHEEHH